MTQLEHVPSFPKCVAVRRALWIFPLLWLNGTLSIGCDGVPFADCRVTSAGGNSSVNACAVSGNSGVAGSTDDPASEDGGVTVGSLVPNGSFEADDQPAAVVATAAPSAWTMLSSANSGNLLHALRGEQGAVPAAAEGVNLAAFDSLTGSSYREAMSSCFPIRAGVGMRVLYSVMVPAAQSAAGTRAAVKLWYFQDPTCATASAIRLTDTQIAAPNAASGGWEFRQYLPSQTSPPDSLAARVSIRAAYNAGTDCGIAGTNCAADKLYFDAIDVLQVP